jgi:hypothetical protein
MPVNADEQAVLASSSESLELWPMLLSKAVYSAYTACGYHNSPVSTDIHVLTEGIMSSVQQSSSFVGFAVHVLTGWQPGTPRSLADTLEYDIHRARGLLQEILFGGAININELNIPTVTPPRLIMGGGVSGGDIVQADLLRLHTKKQFKEEYKLRFAERDRVTEEIELRESQVGKITIYM